VLANHLNQPAGKGRAAVFKRPGAERSGKDVEFGKVWFSLTTVTNLNDGKRYQHKNFKRLWQRGRQSYSPAN
jgi:hypothetical protein